MKVVMQCAGRKNPEAGCMVTAEGKRVMFVASTLRTPPSAGFTYATPNDDCGDGQSWRKRVLSYNSDAAGNTLGLLPAYRLYSNPTYATLVDRVGVSNVYILSAAWGLIPADFLTPNYDVTFQRQQKDADYKQRTKRDSYQDLALLPLNCVETVVFFGGKDYLPLFCALTVGYAGRRIAFYNSAERPVAHGVELVRYETRTRTNWHYECVNAFLAGALSELTR
jgi:hypothetical protein